MPWKACSVMEERLRFVARLLDGESMTDVCREFGISRKIGPLLTNRRFDSSWRSSSANRISRDCSWPARSSLRILSGGGISCLSNGTVERCCHGGD